MRVQLTNLWELVLQSDLSQAPGDDQKAAVVMLLKECRDALYGFNARPNIYSSICSSRPIRADKFEPHETGKNCQHAVAD